MCDGERFDKRDGCLSDLECHATSPKRIPERLRGYQRYFAGDQAERDYGGLLPLFLFETAEAEQPSLDHAAALRHPPFVSSNLPTLAKEGVPGPSWRLPPPGPADRMPLHTVRTALDTSIRCPTVRLERLL